MTSHETFLQYADAPPRFYDFDRYDWTRAFEHAMAVPLHIWLLADVLAQLPRHPVSVFSQYGVVTDRSFYAPVFTRTLNGVLWVACPCEAGYWRKPCRHVAGAHNFQSWREESGLIVVEADRPRAARAALPRRFTC